MADLRETMQALAAEQAAQRVLLQRILDAVDRHRGPRDAADAAVLVAIGETIGDLDDFNARELFEHGESKLHPRLKAALTDADVVTVRDLGRLLPRLEVGVGGLRLECIDATHRLGRRYQLRLCDSE